MKKDVVVLLVINDDIGILILTLRYLTKLLKTNLSELDFPQAYPRIHPSHIHDELTAFKISYHIRGVNYLY